MPKESFADVVTDWEKLLATVNANKDDLQFIDNFRQQLATELAGAREANMRQSAAQAVAQQATRDLEAFLQRGRDLADHLRFGIKTRYGKRNEKLKEFGLKVLRGGGKKKSTTTEKPPPQVGPPQGTSPPEETKAAPQEATSEAHNPS
ncbi:MAG: hypothetical protein ACJ76N_09330 [Thermoanaerobaculia bacterium]